MNAETDVGATSTGLYDAPAARRPARREWGRALAALRRLLRDSDDTGAVFEIMRSLNAGSTHAGYLRLIAGPTGARIAFEHKELEPILMDDAWLDAFEEGTVAAVYRDFVRSERLSAAGLAEVSRGGVANRLDAPDPIAWYRRRMRDVHDLWHVLTDYGRDPLGEACLVGFSYSQTKGLGWLLIGLGAFARGRTGFRGVRGAILEGVRNGGRAAWLPGLDYEALMAMPLDRARRTLGIVPPDRYRAVIAQVLASGIDPRHALADEGGAPPGGSHE